MKSHSSCCHNHRGETSRKAMKSELKSHDLFGMCEKQSGSIALTPNSPEMPIKPVSSNSHWSEVAHIYLCQNNIQQKSLQWGRRSPLHGREPDESQLFRPIHDSQLLSESTEQPPRQSSHHHFCKTRGQSSDSGRLGRRGLRHQLSRGNRQPAQRVAQQTKPAAAALSSDAHIQGNQHQIGHAEAGSNHNNQRPVLPFRLRPE